MVLNRQDIEEYLNDGFTLVVDEYDWKIRIEDCMYLGTVRYDTYLRMDLNNFEMISCNCTWYKRYRLKKGCKIWRY